MLSIHETAYPHLKQDFTEQELKEILRVCSVSQHTFFTKIARPGKKLKNSLHLIT
jgi:hypothetical protein